MTQPVPSHRRIATTVLIVLTLATAALAQTGQISRVTSAGVQKRMDTMNAANAAMSTISDMMGGRAIFDRDRARTARRMLMDTTRKIPSVFRRAHEDPLSNARPEIWLNWKDFRARARAAQRAARALDTGSLPELRQTLPKLLQACLACHSTYRRPMN